MYIIFVGETELQLQISSTQDISDFLDKNPQLHNLITIVQLLPRLNKYDFLTKQEREYLELSTITNCEKVNRLLSTLRSKGKEGEENFVKALYESSKEQGNSGHREIIEKFKNAGICIRELNSEE